MDIRRALRLISHYGAHLRQGIAVTVTCLVLLATWQKFSPAWRTIIGWNAYAASLLALSLTRIISASPRTVIRTATLQHVHRTGLFLFVLGAACLSLGAVASLISSSATPSTAGPFRAQVTLAVLTVILSWLLVHTVFALHYAYLFYRTPNSRRITQSQKRLVFPGQGLPDYWDFVYFSFVIGMTSQVSDVQIASREIRRWVLLHGLIAFAFNAAILAVSINIISGLLSGSR